MAGKKYKDMIHNEVDKKKMHREPLGKQLQRERSVEVQSSLGMLSQITKNNKLSRHQSQDLSGRKGGSKREINLTPVKD